jgi:hypothetical protein
MDQSAHVESGRGRTVRRLPAWLPRALAEAFLIVLSVLLALAVDEWRDQRERSARVDTALRGIAAELRENAESVERARVNHLAMRDSLLVYEARRGPPPARVYMSGLFNPGLVHAAAWQSASERGTTADMPYELLLALSQVYDHQAQYRTMGSALAQNIMSEAFRYGLEAVFRDRAKSFITLQEDFANREAILLQVYRHILTALEQGPGAFPSAVAPAAGAPD